ncbi:MAG: hypothetical protein EOO87_18690 [Pedobacter sp.]|nr:MAG: hypothetical protein EOO87_18690 [Pedobacter sp.]
MDLIYYLGWDAETDAKQNVQVKMPLNLTKDEQVIYNALENETLGIDDLSLRINVAQSKLAITLLTLEMQGVIVSLPGKLYKLA